MSLLLYATRIVLISLIFLSIITCQSQSFSNYQQVKEKLAFLKEQEKSEEAITFLESISNEFPDNEYEISRELAFLYGKIGQYEKSFEIWDSGHQKGFFYGLFPHFPVFEP